MNRKVFQAGNWFLKEDYEQDLLSRRPQNSPSFNEDDIPPLPQTPDYNQNNNKFSKFFTPGWTGGTLTSKEVGKFKKLFDIFHQDCKKSFKNLKNLNRSLISSIYDEFIAYLEFKATNCTGLDDSQTFWRELRNEHSPYREELDSFIELFSLRACGIYLLKIRIINNILKNLNYSFETKYFYYPNSFFTTIFKKGSSTELNSYALESNIYSWYRPSLEGTQHYNDLQDIIGKLTDADIIKNFSLMSENVLNEAAEYSHSVSHVNFGLFLNALLLHLPNWLTSIGAEKFSHLKSQNNNELVSCLFQGDFLESFAVSHWHARNSIYVDSNRNILCPEFSSSNFLNGKFFSIYQQLNFINFLISFAAKNNKPILKFLCDVINGDYLNKQDNEKVQRSLLDKLDDDVRTYDRVVINLANFPKNNAQHHLINCIYAQEKKLKSKGLLFVLSSKKLFVPSQKSKVETLLESFELRSIFTLDEVKGKGEVPSYIYIFTKRSMQSKEDLYKKNKDNCFSFRLSGNLNSFSEYHDFSIQLLSFFRTHRGDIIPMYQKENEKGLRFEFFQDAIVDGRLINSTSKDASKITHPFFFKNLMRSCNPFDFFFDIQTINFKNDNFNDDSFLEYGLNNRNFNFVLIIDKRNNHSGTKIEIIGQQSLEAKVYEYGQSQCFYFGITAKWPNINLNAIEEFYNTKIGRQIIDLTFTNDNRKIKASVNKLLLPKYFIANEYIPEEVFEGIRFLLYSDDDLMGIHPSDLNAKFKNIELLCHDLVTKYPGALIGLLANFKKTLRNCVDKLDSGSSNNINFSNPVLKAPLVLSKTHPIYPNNSDIFIQFDGPGNVNVLHKSLQKIKRKTVKNGEITSHCLTLFSDNQEVISLYSDPDILLFLEFILSNVVGAPIGKILQGVQVPSLPDLKSILQNYRSLRDTFQIISDQMAPTLDQIITRAISQ